MSTDVFRFFFFSQRPKQEKFIRAQPPFDRRTYYAVSFNSNGDSYIHRNAMNFPFFMTLQTMN